MYSAQGRIFLKLGNKLLSNEVSLKGWNFSHFASVHKSCSNSRELYQVKKERNNLLVIMNSHNMRSQFINFFPELIHRLKSCTVFGELPGMQNWIEKVVDYNVQGGKMNRGIALVESYTLLENQKVSEGNMEIAIALGWAVELLQAFFLVADDIMDDSHTRRMKPCWYRTNNLGVKAFNDSILLESSAYQIISSYCRDQPYYVAVLDLFHDVTMKTSLGQAMDLHSSPNASEKPDLSKFTMETYDAIVKYKTAYYSFYLPVALAMRMAGINDERLFKKAEEILLPMGRFFQVQDDYLDCYGNPDVTGKIGTDIEDGKCTWLVVTVLSVCHSSQRKIIEEHYGSKDSESVKLIKNLYTQLEIPKLYASYEEASYNQLTNLIKGLDQLPASIFQGFMEKIYKRLN